MKPTIDWRIAPGLGLLSVGFGFALANATLPLDCQSAGALRLPATIFAVCLLIPCIASTIQSPHSIFHAQNIVAASPIYWLLLDMIQGAYSLEGITQVGASNTFLAIAIFCGSTWLASYFPVLRPPQFFIEGVRIHLSPKQLFGIALMAFFLAFIRFAIPANFDIFEMAAALSRGRWGAAWSRGALGGWDAFLDHFVYFGYVLPILTVLLAKRVGWVNRYTLIVLILTAIIATLLSVGGGRRIIGVLVGSGIIVWFLSSRVFRMRSLFGMSVIAGVLLVVMQVMLLYRNDGLSNILSGDFSERWANTPHLHVDDNFLRVAQITQIIPEAHPYTTWRYLVWIAARPIPRVFWPDKPIDAGFDLPKYLGKQGVSLSASTIGELYMALGFVGCLIGGVFYGCLASSLARLLDDYRRSDGSMMVYGAGTLALFAGMRSGIDLVLMSYGILGWFVIIGLRKYLLDPRSVVVQEGM